MCAKCAKILDLYQWFVVLVFSLKHCVCVFEKERESESEREFY